MGDPLASAQQRQQNSALLFPQSTGPVFPLMVAGRVVDGNQPLRTSLQEIGGAQGPRPDPILAPSCPCWSLSAHATVLGGSHRGIVTDQMALFWSKASAFLCQPKPSPTLCHPNPSNRGTEHSWTPPLFSATPRACHGAWKYSPRGRGLTFRFPGQ